MVPAFSSSRAAWSSSARQLAGGVGLAGGAELLDQLGVVLLQASQQGLALGDFGLRGLDLGLQPFAAAQGGQHLLVQLADAALEHVGAFLAGGRSARSGRRRALQFAGGAFKVDGLDLAGALGGLELVDS